MEKMIKKIDQMKVSSAWERGVRDYALELLQKLIDDFEEEIPPLTEKLLLNGCNDWKEYSYSGNSLIYNRDIALRLCTPSEFKKTKEGKNRPNSKEEWLDTQARALYQASEIILNLEKGEKS